MKLNRPAVLALASSSFALCAVGSAAAQSHLPYHPNGTAPVATVTGFQAAEPDDHEGFSSLDPVVDSQFDAFSNDHPIKSWSADPVAEMANFDAALARAERLNDHLTSEPLDGLAILASTMGDTLSMTAATVVTISTQCLDDLHTLGLCEQR